MALAQLLEDQFNVRETIKLFDKLDFETLRAIEKQYDADINKLIAATETQRPSILRRITKEHPNTRTAEVVLMLAIIAQKRAYDLLETVAPGDGNRVTCARWHRLSSRIAQSFETFEFPCDVFEAYGRYLDFDDEEDDEES